MEKTIKYDELVILLLSEIARHKDKELAAIANGESLGEMLYYGKSSALNFLLDRLPSIAHYKYEPIVQSPEKDIV